MAAGDLVVLVGHAGFLERRDDLPVGGDQSVGRAAIDIHVRRGRRLHRGREGKDVVLLACVAPGRTVDLSHPLCFDPADHLFQLPLTRDPECAAEASGHGKLRRPLQPQLQRTVASHRQSCDRAAVT